MSIFTALDFETADQGRDSACAVGLALVENAKIVRTAYRLIRPPRPDMIFSYIHGIEWEHVAGEPPFGEVWPELAAFFEGIDFITAHNAPFDRGVLKACLRFYGIKFPQPEFICTVRLAREAHPDFPNHKLNTVCREMGIELEHHKAESDALACAKIALEIFKARELDFSPGRLKKTEW